MKAFRYVGSGSGCPKSYLKCLDPNSGYIPVDTLIGGANVTIRARMDGSPTKFLVDAKSRDFLDLATMIYVLDEISKRNFSSDHWTRSFEVLVPVEQPKVWRESQGDLSKMLRTLAGDEYSFDWCSRPDIGGYGEHRLSIPVGFDVVCLFSGGIDSFLGAHKLLTEGKRVLLVGHQADGTAASAQKQLAEVLRSKFPDRLRMIQFRVARSMAKNVRFPLPKRSEDTHRPRSLLFLALGIAIANSVGLSEVYIPENGLIALNPPLGKSRLGSLSTRTAHPKYLLELSNFLKSSGVFNGEIKNPFLFESKTDMLLRLEPSLHAAIRRSVSCARPSRYKNHGVRHCGYCMPCIYRRAAMIGPRLDRSSDYAFDLFGGLDNVDVSKQLDFRSLVLFAKNFLSANQAKRELVILSHGAFSPVEASRFAGVRAKNYDPWCGMIERWAADFLETAKRKTPAKSKRILGL